MTQDRFWTEVCGINNQIGIPSKALNRSLDWILADLIILITFVLGAVPAGQSLQAGIQVHVLNRCPESFPDPVDLFGNSDRINNEGDFFQGLSLYLNQSIPYPLPGSGFVPVSPCGLKGTSVLHPLG